MAIINNLSSSLVSFKVNDVSRKFKDSSGTYNTPNILNSGETYDDKDKLILSYEFEVKNLGGHKIKSAIVNQFILDTNGNLIDSKRFMQSFDGIILNQDIRGSEQQKILNSSEFNINKDIEDNNYKFVYELSNISNKSCSVCIESIILNLSDINYKIHISFTGPNSNRTASNIKINTILLSLDAEQVTFSKDPTQNFDPELDNIEGRTYFRKGGIYVDGYQYSTIEQATANKLGLVKVVNNVERNTEGIVVPPNVDGVVPSIGLIYNLVQDISNGVIPLPKATQEQKGVVILSDNSFQIEHELDKEGNIISSSIIAPEGEGIAATPQLVFNSLASSKNYTDEQIGPIRELIEGIEAPLIINIENDNNEKELLGEELTFSNDFEQIDKKLYIKWLEIT